MSDFLVDHALKNVWCTPDQDNQLIIKPAKLTPRYGVENAWKIMWTNFVLPLPKTRFHLYQIGQVYPLLVNLFPKQNEWVKLSDVCNTGKTICNIYLTSGVELPRTETWYIVTEENNIVLAVKQNPKIEFDAYLEPIYLRVYDNAYFASTRADVAQDYILVAGGTMTSVSDITTLQTLYNQKAALTGAVYVLCNGYKIKEVSLITVAVGDVVEFVYDSSISAVVDFKISDLKNFDSELDVKAKYIIHHLGGVGDTIDFEDDVDVFVIDGTSKKGVYYHKNTLDALRSVTHRDYSVPVSNVEAYLSSHPTVLPGNNAYLRLHIRKSGYLRPLANENNRIKELYKLSDNLINQALTGVDSTVSVWTASGLEKSYYPVLMGSKYKDVTRSLVKNAYGYNAVSKIAADSPVATALFNSQNVALTPYLFQINSTAFEYDVNGLLIDWHTSAAGQLYNCVDANTKLVEFINGLSTDAVDDHYNATTVTLDPNLDYRFYTTPTGGTPGSRVWTDVTGGAGYAVISGVATWLTGSTYDTLVRSNKTPLVKQLFFTAIDGLLRFNITHLQTWAGVTTDKTMEVPMGELDVFLNKHSLIEGLDYFVNFPVVTIVNKEYLVDPSLYQQEVILKFTGLCKTNLSRTTGNDFGFVRNGYLSVNHRFNIRDDKVNKIILAGALVDKNTLSFSEDSSTYTFVNSLNGKPYLIKDVVVPVKSLVSDDTYIYRDKSVVIDQAIADYLTLKLPEVEPSTANPISGFYKLYSPFICKIIFDLKHSVINSPTLKQQYNDDQVRDLVSSYLPILLSDPIYPDNLQDMEYVIVHPTHLLTTISLDIYQYTFLNRVIALYGRGLINVTSHVTMV